MKHNAMPYKTGEMFCFIISVYPNDVASLVLQHINH